MNKEELKKIIREDNEIREILIDFIKENSYDIFGVDIIKLTSNNK